MKKETDIKGLIPRYYRAYNSTTIRNEKDLIFFGKPAIREMIKDWEILARLIGEIKDLAGQVGQSREGLEEKIKILSGLERRARMKPALPGYRPYGWFKPDDPVVCFIGRLPEKTVPDKFITETIIRTDGDERVAVELNHSIGNKYNRGHKMPRGLRQPEIMHLWEFEYLIKHPKFAEMWLSNAVCLEIISMSHAESFLLALTETRTQFRLRGKNQRNKKE